MKHISFVLSALGVIVFVIVWVGQDKAEKDCLKKGGDKFLYNTCYKLTEIK